MNRKAVELLRSATFISKLGAPSILDGIEKMLAAVAGNPAVLDLNSFRRAVLERQKMNPPFAPSGVAFPHARTDAVQALVVGVATLASPLPADAINIRLMFLIGIPKTATQEYLELMSFLTRNLRTPSAVEELCRITDKDQFLGALAAS
ncbi:MAG: PTS sugar transporter subunit IIA [Verrucomicrobia bacterium]|nr:PTS sugar transporter subunit IIA [Verrucomicrobiota bacterium]